MDEVVKKQMLAKQVREHARSVGMRRLTHIRKTCTNIQIYTYAYTRAYERAHKHISMHVHIPSTHIMHIRMHVPARVGTVAGTGARVGSQKHRPKRGDQEAGLLSICVALPVHFLCVPLW